MTPTPAPAIWPANHDGLALVDMTLGDMLDGQAATFGGRMAVCVDDAARGASVTWTYAQLRDHADRAARGMIALGVQAGDRVALMAPNCAEWVMLEYALAKVGAVLVTVNPALKRDELAYVLAQGRVSALIFTPQFRGADIAADLLALMPDLGNITNGHRTAPAEFPLLRNLVCIGQGGSCFARPFADMLDLGDTVPDSARQSRQAAVQTRDVAQIQYTSGTTGKPKGAMLTHYSTLNNARLMADRGGYTPDDVMLSAMPLFHTAGCVCNVMAMLACGGCLVTMDAFDPARMLALWQRHSPTLLNAVPTMMTRMLEHPDAAQTNMRTLRRVISGGTSIPPSLMRRMRDQTGGEPLIIMGMTECSPVITQTWPGDDLDTRLQTAGTPLPHTEIRIIDPYTGAVVPFGTAGELCIRGYLTMAGYFDMPDKTAETIDSDGWLHSGDLAVLEESGHLRIVGRLKDMVIRGGENVYPVEIETCLLDHPSVSQAQVVGVPDPELGEEIFAFVVLTDGGTATETDLQGFCKTRMARHKMPKYISLVDRMPMTANGKIQKFALRHAAATAIADGTIKAVRR
ncbi:AMP-binding protein [Roseinatronobacter sp. S2]|uniref:AMP-binding protein n=1 Tax=Roseinatronobacter sp. S2 TaxID=3035471 RepID=UPI00240F2D7C|nr:AMP-binding protein [Roseinatronobacter sp. S2]WFE74678.1 AMP-binding protein [Roseinatronobacter sp. S2]